MGTGYGGTKGALAAMVFATKISFRQINWDSEFTGRGNNSLISFDSDDVVEC